MATRRAGTSSKSSTRRSSRSTAGSKARSKTTARKQRSSAGEVEVAKVSPLSTAAERRRMAREEARWRAESDLRTLRAADEIRRDKQRLNQAAGCAAEEMRALKAIRAIKPGG